ncbi:hypothetical protein ANN_25019 [Periplaneta americana]|uniref:Uncharacterized protein n=1 Tax=Periplaneta americana TaxID=6978 RepID=A0ABQ8S0C0_PERAM|nr:hypothetical protein ANN_25019 [Periplaneta americana]
MLQTTIVPAIRELYGDERFYLQQDGALAHYHRDIRMYLDEILPGRWIGRRGAVEYPAGSPDLTSISTYGGSQRMGKRQLHWMRYENKLKFNVRNVINLVDTFRATECTERKKSVRWPRKVKEDAVEDARERMQRGPNKSVKKLAVEIGVCYGSAHKIVRNKLGCTVARLTNSSSPRLRYGIQRRVHYYNSIASIARPTTKIPSTFPILTWPGGEDVITMRAAR